jgi:glutaconate CoA-transferase, subunit A
MSDLFTTLSQAIALVSDGDVVALEGFTHLIPFAAAHEIIRQGRRNLTLVRMTPDLICDQLIGAGCASRLVFSWGGNPGVGSLHRLRDAVERDWPVPLALEEYTHAALANAYEAGACNLPFGIFRGHRGDLALENPKFRTLQCPYTAEELTTVPAMRPDVAVVHAQKADADGNVLVEGIIGVQKQVVLAARTAIVTVEERVHEFTGLHPNACVLPHWTIDAIAVAPRGAAPSYAHGYYERDNAYYIEWEKLSADRETFQQWLDQHVLNRAVPA